MPQKSGSYTFAELKRINPGIRVLLSSGCSINGQASALHAEGCNGFIQKPFAIDALARKVRKAFKTG